MVGENVHKDEVLCFDFTTPSSVKRKSRYESRFSRFLQNSHFATQSEPEIEIFSDKRVALNDTMVEIEKKGESGLVESGERATMSPIIITNEKERESKEKNEEESEKNQQEKQIDEIGKDEEVVGAPEKETILDGVAKEEEGRMEETEKIEKEAVEAIADKAIELDTGARGLRTIIENAMMDLMYSAPDQKDIERVTVTADVIKNKAQPLIIRKKAA